MKIILKTEVRMNPEGINQLIQPYDLIVGVVSGFMGFNTVKTKFTRKGICPPEYLG